MKKKTIFIFIILICSIYQDLPLVNVFGEIARTPIVFLTFPMLIYLFAVRKIVVSYYTKYLFIYWFYLLCLTIFYVLIIVIKNDNIIFLKENIFLKSVKMALYPLLIIVYYQFVYTLLSRRENTFNTLFRVFILVQAMMIVFLFFEIEYLKKGIPFLRQIHSLRLDRIRLLTLEESWVGSIITIFVFVPVFLVNYLKKALKTKYMVYFISAFLFLYYTFNSRSKGYLLIVLISMLPIFLDYLYSDKKRRKYFFIMGAFVLSIGGIVFISLYKTIESNLYYSSGTFGTRFGLYLAAVKIFMVNPLGIGLGSYIHYLPKEITEIVSMKAMQIFDLKEISGYQYSTFALSTKTYFFDQLIYGGIGFLVFMYFFFIKRYLFFSRIKDSNFFFVKIPLIFIFLAGVIYITFDIKYEIWFFLAFLDVLQNKINRKEIL